MRSLLNKNALILHTVIGVVTIGGLLTVLKEDTKVVQNIESAISNESPEVAAFNSELKSIKAKGSEIDAYLRKLDQSEGQSFEKLLTQAAACLESTEGCPGVTREKVFVFLDRLQAKINTGERVDEDALAERLYRLSRIEAPLAMASMNLMRSFSSPNYLGAFFQMDDLSAEAKAHLSQTAYYHGDEELRFRAKNLIHSLVTRGTASEAFAALAKLEHFPEVLGQDAYRLQESLCRFGGDDSSEFQFHMMKSKWERVIGRSQDAEPWSVRCRS